MSAVNGFSDLPVGLKMIKVQESRKQKEEIKKRKRNQNITCLTKQSRKSQFTRY